MKRFMLILEEKIGKYMPEMVFVNAETEEEAREYFENNFNRFNNLVKVEEWRTM